MASDAEGADAWAALCKYVETREPLDIIKIYNLWEEAEGLSHMESLVDVSRDLSKFARRGVALDSEVFKGWWSEVQASPSLITRTPMNPQEWRYLMDILTRADVSKIEHLMLKCGDSRTGTWTDGDSKLAYDQLGIALSRSDFCQLKTLIVRNPTRDPRNQFESGSLADAMRGTGLTNLRTLWLPASLDSMVLNVLSESRTISQLTSYYFVLNRRHQVSTLDTIFESGSFQSLQSLCVRKSGSQGSYLNSSEGTDGFWEVFTKAIRSQNLQRLACLFLVNFKDVNLADFFRELRDCRFDSLERLRMENCGITSEQVCSFVRVLMEDPKTPIALKSLGLIYNDLDHRAVLALVRLADSHILPQLQELDLSFNSGLTSKSLVALVESIAKGGLSSLRKLDWTLNRVHESEAKTVVQAYYEHQSLTTEITGIHWDRFKDHSLKTKLKTYRDRKLRLAALTEKFGEKFGEDVGDFVPLTYAKVFLCGFAEVGKTTLRRALLRSQGMKTALTWETRPESLKVTKEARTRGIEISRIAAEKNSAHNSTLVVWDLAGQEEYHVLHGTFLPDLGFVGGKATTFTLVFRARVEIDAWADVEEKLGYWLRFVASSSRGLAKRHVVVVLNRFDGKTCGKDDQALWKALIKKFATMFSDLLDIHPDPFISDVRKAAQVHPLKRHLFNHAEESLQKLGVPRICMELHKVLNALSEGQNNNQRCILTWPALEEMWKSKSKSGNRFSTRGLKIVASYLHEMGEIIYFEKEKEDESGDDSIVIPDPEWFCRKVVGDLLLPEGMLEGSSCIKVREDGSIPLHIFEAFFQNLLVGGVQSSHVISMLELIGLCYKKTEEEIIVPALIRNDDYDSIVWERKGVQMLMGRCLAAIDKEKNIVPVTLFRRLQVKLAQDFDFGGREDSDYRVGKSFANFKHGEFLVLIQFDVDHSDPTDDRIDILVKSAMDGDAAKLSSEQVQCICNVMQKLEELCAICCDGLRYEIKVIKPSRAADRTQPMSQRNLIPLQHIKDLLVKGKQFLGWQVDGQNVTTESLLSEMEVERLLGTVRREYEECKQDAVAMGLLPKDRFCEDEALEEDKSCNSVIGDIQSLSMRPEANDQETLSLKIFLGSYEEIGSSCS